MDLKTVIGVGVAGNFTGHLEQAGEAGDFVNVQVKEKHQPKGLFPFYIPGYTSHFLSTYPLSSDTIALPPENYKQDTDKSGLIVHHLSRFAFCAYPAKYDWRHKLTFILNQDGITYTIDNGGKPIAAWPTDEELAERFTKVELD